MSTAPLISGEPVSYDSMPSSPPGPAAGRKGKRASSSSLRSIVDLANVQEGWARWKRKLGKDRSGDRSQAIAEKPKELMYSVFGSGGSADDPTLIPGVQCQPSEAEFATVVESVKRAIAQGIQPKLIAKGSSGSYFARNEGGHVRAVFKPKDEEPYGRLNPKWTKWIHRTFFAWVGFGRACLIPNLSYISEAAASRLDRRLGLGLVPLTELEALSSPAFFYDWVDRTAHATKGRALPDKVGSFQLFLRGFADATQWLKEHPWPNGVAVDESSKAKSSRHHLRRCLRVAIGVCGRAEAGMLNDDDDDVTLADDLERGGGRFRWTTELKDEFCSELQKLVALDFLMLNTDRGLDNFMIRYSSAAEPSAPKSIVDQPPSPVASPTASKPPKLPKVSFEERRPHVQIAAIDNSLSFPWKHPDGWRSYPFGWLFLPVSLVGRPFGESIREHLIPLLSSPAWWEKTVADMRKLMTLDADFNEAMFQRQMSVMKGQGYQLLASLKEPDEGPLELCRRPKLEICTDDVEVPDDAETERLIAETLGRAFPPAPPAPAVQVHPAASSVVQDILRSAQDDDGTPTPATSPHQPTRPRPLSASADDSANWKSFQGVSGISVMRLLDKESRRRGKSRSSARATSKPSVLQEEEGEDSLDARGAFSDGEGERSTSQRGRGKRLHPRRGSDHRPRTHRSLSAGGVGDRDDAASLDGLSHSVMSGTAPGADERAPGRLRRPAASVEHSYRSADDRASAEWLLGSDGGGHEAAPRTRIVKVERIKEVQAHALFVW